MSYNPIHPHCGPANKWVSRSPTSNKLDEACRKHDLKYAWYLKRGKNPYRYYNAADARFIKEMRKIGGFAARLYSAPFVAKRKYATRMFDWTARKRQKVTDNDAPLVTTSRSSLPNNRRIMPIDFEEKQGNQLVTSDYDFQSESFQNQSSKDNMARYSKTYRKRRPRRRYLRNGRKRKAMSRRVRNYRPQISTVQTYIKSDARQLTSAVNTKGYQEFSFTGKTDIENYINATLPTIDNTTVTYKNLTKSNGKVKVVGGYYKLELRNNYAFDVSLSFYHLQCVDNTDLSPVTLLDNFSTAQVKDPSQAAITDPHTNPAIGMDLFHKDLKSYWRFLGVRKFTLQPAEEKTIFFKLKKSYVDLAEWEAGGTREYRKFFSDAIITAQIGNIVHDVTDPTQVGYGESKVDCITTFCFKYQCSQSEYIRRIELDSNLDTIASEEVMQDQIELVAGVDNE